MRTFCILIIFAVTGCNTNNTTGPAAPEEAIDWHKGMPTSIPGQPEKATVPSITGGGEGDPCTEYWEVPIDTFFGNIDELVKGEIESVSFVLDDVFDRATGERISFAKCQNVERFPPVLKVVLKDATSLFGGDIGTTEFLIPTQGIYQMESKPSFFYQGRWYPRDETPARIDGTVGWSRADSGLQAGQIVMVPLLETRGIAHNGLFPIFQEMDGIFEGVHMGFDCDRGPILLGNTFEWEDVVEAFQTSGEVGPSALYDFSVSLAPFCNESPPPQGDPVVESDM